MSFYWLKVAISGEVGVRGLRRPRIVILLVRQAGVNLDVVNAYFSSFFAQRRKKSCGLLFSAHHA
jgi:hypothetical protein